MYAVRVIFKPAQGNRKHPAHDPHIPLISVILGERLVVSEGFRRRRLCGPFRASSPSMGFNGGDPVSRVTSGSLAHDMRPQFRDCWMPRFREA
jgi:hypothetical protein